MERGCWVNFQCRGVLLVWMIVGQGPVALAVGVGGGCLDIFLSSVFFSSFSLSLEDGPIKTEILSQRAVKPKTTNQPTIVGKGHTVLAVGAGGVFGHFFSRLSFLFSFSLSLGDGPI